MKLYYSSNIAGLNSMPANLKIIIILVITFLCVHLGHAGTDPCLAKPVFAIETATASESTELLAMIAPVQKIQRDGIKYYCGRFKGQQVIFMYTGIGKVYAAATNASLINTYHPKFILFLGVAGQIDPKLKYGDLVIGKEIYQVEHLDFRIGTHINKNNPHSELKYSSLLRPQSKIIQFVKTLPPFKKFSLSYGRIATTDTFPETKNLLKQIIKSNSSAVAMEDYAVLATCQLLNTNCLTVRAISDNPLKILHMENAEIYHIEGSQRLHTAKNLAEFARVFLEKWFQNKQKEN